MVNYTQKPIIIVVLILLIKSTVSQALLDTLTTPPLDQFHIDTALTLLNANDFCVMQRVNTELYPFTALFFGQYNVKYDQVKEVFNAQNVQNQHEYSISEKPLIEMKTHRVWLAKVDRDIAEMIDYLQDPQILDRVLSTNQLLSSDGKHQWQHYLWVNEEHKMPKTIQWAEGNGFIIRNIKDLNEDQFVLDYIYDMIQNDEIVQSTDLIRGAILKQEGGMYLDLDVWLEKWDNRVLYISDFIVQKDFKWYKVLLPNGDFIMSRNHHPIIEGYFKSFKSQFNQKSQIQDIHSQNKNLIQFKPCFLEVSETAPYQIGIFHKINAIIWEYQASKSKLIILKTRKEDGQYNFTVDGGQNLEVEIVVKSLSFGQWRNHYADSSFFGFQY